MADHDDVMGRAGQIAYSLFFAVFPLLIFLTAILGIIAGPDSRFRASMVSALTNTMPPSAADLIREFVSETSSASGAGKVSFGLLLALVSASSGIAAIMDALNSAYALRESRPVFKVRLIALGLTVAIGTLIVASTAVILFGDEVISACASAAGFSRLATLTSRLLQWPLAVLFLLLVHSLIYFFGPDLPFRQWRWITPGAVTGVTLSLGISLALRGYLRYFNSFTRTYGSLGAVMILLLWFYVMGLAILLGGEVNSAIENAATQSGTPETRRRDQAAPASAPGKAA